MKKKSNYLIALIFLLTLFNVNGAAKSGIDALEVNFKPVPVSVLPLDKIIKHKFTVKNNSNKSMIIDFDGKIIKPFKQHLDSVTPEPQKLYLEPGETGTIIAKFDEKHGKLPNFMPGSNPKPGKFKREIEWIFKDTKTNKKKKFYVTIEFIVLDKDKIKGDLIVGGNIIDENGVAKSETEVVLSTGYWKTSTITDENGNFSFPGVPARDDWILTATEGIITGEEEKCVPEPPPGPSCPNPPQRRGFAFVTPDKSKYTLILKNPKLKASYKITKSIKTNIGFWTGDVDDEENHVLLINGMENWKSIPESKSKLYLFTLDGDLVWKYDLSWQGWNTDLSPDGKYAAFVTSMCDKKTKCPFGVIETATGKPLWIKKSKQIKVTEHPKLDTKEIQISNNNKYLAVGGIDGTFILFDLKTGKILWTKFIYGQIRGILFDKNDNFIYAGTGDRNAYKLNIKDGSIVWKANIGSWPYVGAFKLSKDESLLASGGKYGDVAVIKTKDGQVKWYEDMNDVVSWLDFSPDGKYLVAGGGGQYATTLYRVDNGKKIWRIEGFTHQGKFSPDGRFIMMGDRNIRLVDIHGNDLTNLEFSEEGCRPGCGGIFAYVSKDGSKIIYTRRDINPSHSIFFVNGTIKEWVYKNTPVTKKTKRKDKNLKSKDENDKSVFSSKQIQCLTGLFGDKRAEELTKEEPSAEEMKKMAPCMGAGKTNPKPKNEKGLPSFTEKQLRCLADLFGKERAEALTKEKPGAEEIKKMAACMEAGKTKPKPKNEKGPIVFGPQQMQCLIDVFGSKKAESIRLEGMANVSPKDIKKMEPCMDPSKTKPKPKNGKGPIVYSPKQMECLNDVFGPKKAESLRLGGLANASQEEIKKMEPCIKP